MYHYAGCALSVDRILKSDTRNREFVEYIARLLRDLSLVIDLFFSLYPFEKFTFITLLFIYSNSYIFVERAVDS